MRVHILPVLCLFVSTAQTLPAQQAASGPVCVVFPVKDLSVNPSARDYEQTITQAVGAAFGAGGYRLLPDPVWREAAAARSVDLSRPVSQLDALGVAAGVGADFAVTGVYWVQDDEIYYSVQCWSVASGTLAAALQADTPFNLAFFSGLNLALSGDLLPRLPAAGQTQGGVVFVSPDEGMVVKLSGDQYAGRVTKGRVSLPADSVVPGSRILIQKSKPGFHPAEQTVTMTASRAIPLKPLVKEHSAAVELDSTLGQLLGLGAAIRAYAVPDWFFIVIGNSLWVQPPVILAPRVVVHADTSAGFGGYIFFSPDAPLRVGVSGGAGCILSFLGTPGTPFFSDLYIDVVSWWVETRLFGATLFMRQDFKYALGRGVNLLGQGWMIGPFPPTTLGMLFQW